MRCFAVLMAAGFSKRFGKRNKLLVPFRGKPLARHTLDLVCGMGCFEKIIFVVAEDAAAALAEDAVASGLPVTVIRNKSPEKGQGESVRLGVLAAPAIAPAHAGVPACAGGGIGAEPAYYFFFPCDQPLLDADTVRLLLDAARPGCIVEPNGYHSPCLFCASFRDELLALRPGEQARLIKFRHSEAVISVEVPNPAVLADIDTPDDMAVNE